MLATTHFDQLIVLLFFGIAILFQILTRAAAKGRRRSTDTRRRSTSPPQVSHVPSGDLDETDEERVRRFLEALGQPTTSKPPPPVAPRPTYQRPTVLPHFPPLSAPLPPLTTRPPDLPQKTRLPKPVIPKRETRTVRPRVAEASALEVHEGPVPLQPITVAEGRAAFQPAGAQPSTKRLHIAAMLRSTFSLQDAIILREIFGPPRSLQPLDLVGAV